MNVIKPINLSKIMDLITFVIVLELIDVTRLIALIEFIGSSGLINLNK